MLDFESGCVEEFIVACAPWRGMCYLHAPVVDSEGITVLYSVSEPTSSTQMRILGEMHEQSE
jgi:hypothetical protein